MLHDFLVVFQKFMFGATAGVLIEHSFTGVYSLVVNRNLKGTTSSYLWMPAVYGLTVVVLDLVRQLGWSTVVTAPIYTGVFYAAEALSGLAIRHLTLKIQNRWPSFHGGGVVPWEYPKSKWAPAGLVNFKYLPFWFALGLLFDPIGALFQKIAVFLAAGVQ